MNLRWFSLGLLGLILQANAFQQVDNLEPIQVGVSISSSAGMVYLKAQAEIPPVRRPSVVESGVAYLPHAEISVNSFQANILGVRSVLKRRAFLDVQEYPAIVVSDVKILKDSHLVTGTLEIKGYIVEVTGTWKKIDPRDGVPEIQINFPIKLSDFDLADHVTVLLIRFRIDNQASVTVDLANPFE
jgi:hypothetical protein